MNLKTTMELHKISRSRIIFGLFCVLAVFLMYIAYITMQSQASGTKNVPLYRTNDVPPSSTKVVSRWKGDLQTQSKHHTIKTRRVAFLKVPKTGSSTLACVFIRFGIKNNLTIFLPRVFRIYDSDQNRLIARRLHYDMFIIHTHYNYHFFTNIVKNPAIIGIVREPEKRIISHAFFSLKHEKRFKNVSAQDFIDKIVANTEKYKVRNIMSLYFRIPNSVGKNKSKLNKVLDQLNSEFLLVLVLERMDESLVLMKRLLNWSFADIVYVKMKENHHPKVSLNNTQKEQLRLTNKLDYEVYDFFVNELDKKIRNAGEDLHKEVQYFRYVMGKVDEFCQRRNSKAKKYTFEASKWESSFSIYDHTCTMLRKDVNELKRGRFTDFK